MVILQQKHPTQSQQTPLPSLLHVRHMLLRFEEEKIKQQDNTVEIAIQLMYQGGTYKSWMHMHVPVNTMEYVSI